MQSANITTALKKAKKGVRMGSKAELDEIYGCLGKEHLVKVVDAFIIRRSAVIGLTCETCEKTWHGKLAEVRRTQFQIYPTQLYSKEGAREG